MDTVTLQVPEDDLWMLFRARAVENDTVTIKWHARQTVKDLVESVGIPHVEVSHFFIGRQRVEQDQIVQPGDDVSLDTLDILPYCSRLFLADVHLGKLASLLRLIGFDTIYACNASREYLLETAQSADAVLLSRSRSLLMGRSLEYGMLIRSTDPDEQLEEVCRRFSLIRHIQLFSRCPHCSGMIYTVEKSSIEDLLQEGTRSSYDSFYRCSSCRQIYWYGAHYPQLIRRIDALREHLL